MKKIFLIPGVRFHSEYYIDHYINYFQNPNIFILSSSPKSKFKKKIFNHIFIPYIFKILFKIIKVTEPNFLKRIDQFIFMYISSILIYLLKPDIIHSWGGISFKLINKNNSSVKILERSSTYLPKQLKVINDELKKNGINKTINYNYDIKNFYKELELFDNIIIPSNYVYESYPEIVKKKLIIIYPFSTKIYDYSYKQFFKDQKIIGYVGSNIFVKGLLYLFKSFNSLSDNSYLWLKINKSDLNQLKLEDRKLILNHKNIKICGSSMEMKYFYSSIDCLIQPSIDDGFNMVTIEALSVGVPTFTNNNMGSSEFLKYLLPKNIFNLNTMDQPIKKILYSINKNSLINQSNILKKEFPIVLEKFIYMNKNNFQSIFINNDKP